MILAEDLSKLPRSQFHCRTRRCLRKGCEDTFRASHPASRYCSDECRKEVHRWHNKRAQRRYRKTAKCKAKRSEQARNRRQRTKAQKRTKFALPTERVGHHNEPHQGLICARPGCYECVIPTRRSPCQKYCSKPCRVAMRCVLERERRWCERLTQRKRSVAGIEDV